METVTAFEVEFSTVALLAGELCDLQATYKTAQTSIHIHLFIQYFK